MWKSSNPLMRYEAELIEEAGVELDGRHMLRFIPIELEQQLAEAELEFASMSGHESEAEIALTVFRCITTDGGYEFRIADQRYRPTNEPQ
ncbi:hypothetical protein RSSM_00509 [Rhodopirellula sallentina SM41]|uniref:Uncharacterized protein n=1 Tax=Rhodopirellula sallentina SM41 TaxID=1263870 RepID=M5U980_9BACT|nr:hypothetical protein RSSM_00509 [Rhodopirellula sallentina SM41]